MHILLKSLTYFIARLSAGNIKCDTFHLAGFTTRGTVDIFFGTYVYVVTLTKWEWESVLLSGDVFFLLENTGDFFFVLRLRPEFVAVDLN